MAAFDAAVEPHRRELVGYCYRLLGAWDDAEDAVQETYVRAWRYWDSFEQRSSVRTWLHRIATRVALSALEGRQRRALPSGLADADDALPWIQPYADDRDDLRLALIAGLQTLTPSQRAVLVLRDVLAFPAAEVASMLDVSIGAVKSTLQRARATLARVAPRPEDVVEPRSAEARKQLEAYVAAFEKADVSLLLDVLRADASLEVMPGRPWFDGIAACTPVLTDAVGAPGDWRMDPCVANGQPAARVWFRGEPMGVVVLDCRVDGIASIRVFGDSSLVARVEWTSVGRGGTVE
ncbi:RNA polymerase subunit sigma-70 [Cryptosporangium phraense]|uniref:Sigma-70 family RNA polymerase sigma factor n=1 Tax=Cryptosporangium phraense TaxID=2593070 RepID=A0A545AGB2_9ACTN|nr:RNA polymerase subunit sigma-70 [Cryptosporangium phraense]TQS40354.1 sigma-70 family RNA polymerase sigma factor [Cryptosporangium phraense]